MSEIPKGWFYIESPTRKNQVLTVPNMSMQASTRVELRPKAVDFTDHQLWCYHNGFLVNKQSGCVLGVEKEKKFKEQQIYQSKRLDENNKRQIWNYKEGKLYLIDDSERLFGLNDLAVPKVVEIENATNFNLKY